MFTSRLSSRVAVVIISGALLSFPAPTFACNWSSFSTPNLGTHGDVLNDIAAVSATDAIAVGVFQQDSGDLGALILGYSGTPPTWKIIPINQPGIEAQLSAVSPFSSNGAWIAGQHVMNHSGPGLALAAELSSGTFTTLPAPFPSNAVSAQLNGVQSLTSTAAIFVGWYQTTTAHLQNYAVEWTGEKFVNLNPPNVSVASFFTDIKKIPGTTDVAVSGYHSTDSGQVPQVPFVWVYHTLTNSWSTPTGLKPGYFSQFNGVAAVSQTEIWAVGFERPSSKTGTTVPEIQKFNASTSKFTLQTLPSFNATNAQLERAAASSAFSALAVGYTEGRPIALKWDGVSWTDRSPTLCPSCSSWRIFTSVAAIPASTDYFVAGDLQDGAEPGTLVAKASCP